MSGGFYSAGRAKRSLWHFLAGKGASALMGVVWLVWVVRSLPAAEYGTFVALLAVVEIFYLATGLGLSTMAQRYVAEYRIHAPAAQFRRFVLGLLAARAVLAALAAGLLALGLGALLRWWGVGLTPALQGWFLAWLVAGCVTRYFDELFPALLLQGASQGLSFGANVLRIGFALWAGQQGLVLDHQALVLLELALAAGGAAVGLVLLLVYLRQHPGAAQGTWHHNPGMVAVAVRFYAVQLMGQFWSGNAAKLVLSRMVGAVPTAAFGFCLALVDMLRNYLPAYLLATWVRPLMVSRYLQSRSLEPVAHMANAVFKLSLLGVLPFAAFFASQGDAFAAWVSAGRYGAGAGALLAVLVVWLALQCLHVVVSMVTATVEQPTPNLWATALGCAALPLGALLVPWSGVLGIAGMLCLAEAVWVAFVLAWLARAGTPLHLDWAGCARIVLCAAVAAGVLALLPATQGPWLLLPGLLAAAIVLGGSAWLKPLKDGERSLMGHILPARWILW